MLGEAGRSRDKVKLVYIWLSVLSDLGVSSELRKKVRRGLTGAFIS